MFDWLQGFADRFVYQLCNFDSATHWAQALNFFVFDSIKIFLLLVLIVHLMTVINHYLPIEKIRHFLSTHKLYGLECLFSAFFGVITPFCSCSAIPLFVGFLRAGIPLGITFTFLITAPMVNEVAITLLYGLFGFKVMAVYIGTGIILGIVGGFVLGKLKMDDQIADFIRKPVQSISSATVQTKVRFISFLKQISTDAFAIILKIMPYVFVGIAIGGAIHGFVPTGFFQQYISADNQFAVPLAVLLGVPMYSNSAGVIPVVQSLIAKGIPMGTALAFMMAVIGLSLPEFMILKKVMKIRLLLTYFGLIAGFMVIAGYIFNLVF